MKLKYLLTLYIFATSIAFLQARIITAFAIARHGAEYPRNDLYDGNQTKVHRGELTSIGLRQHYNLGTYLRRAYALETNLIQAKYNPNNVRFFSTTYQRTLQSNWAFINGLYPLGSGWTIPQQITSDKLNPPYKPLFSKNLQQDKADQPFALSQGFTPVPVRSLDQILDNCPNYDVLLANRNQQILPFVQILQSQQRSQIQRLKNIFNLNSSQQNIPTMSELYQTLYADQYLGRPLPSSYNSTDSKNLKYIYEYYNSLVFDGNFAKVLSTPILRMLRQTLSNAIKKSNLKFTMIIAHRSNLMPLVTLLNLTSSECLTQKWKGQTVKNLNCVSTPQFAASLIFQLHEDDSFKHFVSIKYNGQYVYLCDRKDFKCVYEEFISRIQAIQVDFETQCGVRQTTSKDIVQM